MTELEALRLKEDLEKRRHDIWNKSVIPDVKANSTEWISGVNENGDIYKLAFTLITPYSIMVQAIEDISGTIKDEDIKFRCLISDTFADVLIKLIYANNLFCKDLEGHYLSTSSLFTYKYTSKRDGHRSLTLKMDNTSIIIEDYEVTKLAKVLDYFKDLNWTLKEVTLVEDPFTEITLKYVDINDIKLIWQSDKDNDRIEAVFNNDEDFQGLILHMKTVIALEDSLAEYRIQLGDLTLNSGETKGSSLTFYYDDTYDIIIWKLESGDKVFKYNSSISEFNTIVNKMDKFFQEIFIKCNQTV